MNHAGNLALFLLEKTGSIWGTWKGKMNAVEQRALFGRFIGKGTIVIDGLAETLCNRVNSCLGRDQAERNQYSWNDL